MATAATRPAATANDPAGWTGAFTDLPREHGYEPLDVEGTIPAELRGTMVRNGATLFSAQGRRYDHWFDGDGGLSAVRFEDGRVRGAARLVQSAGLLEERRAGRMLYGGYGTVQPGLLNRLRGRVKNTGNTSVMYWNRCLYALMEACLPTEIDIDDLTTVGETDLGVVPRAFSAHPHHVPGRGASYNFGVRYGRKTLLDLFELRDGGGVRRLASLPLPGATMIHDFIATERHLVFFVPPLRLRVLRAMLGLGGYSANLMWRPELGTEVLVVPIDDPEHPVRFTTEAFYQWHFANAFERGGEIVVDLARYRDFSSNELFADLFRRGPAQTIDGTFHRMVIDPAARRISAEQRWDRPCEFPRVAPAHDGRAYRHAWLAAHSPASGARGLHDAVARLDVETGAVVEWRLPAGQYTSEPVFVPRPGATAEDDGWVLALVYDAGRHASGCAVLDGRDLGAGPVARAWFDHHVPPRFHGVWVPAT